MFKEFNDLNTLKVVDFGLATFSNLNEFPFPKCGTPGYVAPEVANLKDIKSTYDKVCDIFSAGCIFYKM
jgi:serine/threonine protein kinase